jgi:hypothetical protein
MVGEAFKLGGWGMYPVLVFGILLLGASIWYAVTPERKRLLLPAVLGIVTFSAGLLGFLTGVMVSLTYAAENADMAKFVAVGTAESLNNVGFALAWIVMSGLVVAVGAFRAGRQKPEPAKAAQPVEAHG